MLGGMATLKEEEEDEALVKKLCDVGSGLSQWGAKFAGSLDGFFRRHGFLSEKQRNKAKELLADIDNE